MLAGGLLIAWTQWQPQRSEEARETALAQLARNPRAATAAAESAVSHDPLSVEALFALADVQAARRHPLQARATLEKAVRLQPSNPRTWLALGRLDLPTDPAAAVQEMRAGIYLDPASISPEALTTGHPEAVQTYNDYVQALRAVAQRETVLRTAHARHARARAVARRARRAARRAARNRTRR